MDPYAPLISLLRSGPEHVKIAIECETEDDQSSALSTTSLSTASKDLLSHQDVSRPERSLGKSKTQQRIVALITNVEKGYEEGCVFVFKRDSREPTKVKLIDGLPILPGFKASIQQVASANITPLPSPSTSALLKICMSLSSKTISAVSSDAQAVRDLLRVLRESERLAAVHSEEGRQTHRWVERYMDVDRNDMGSSAPIFSRFSRSSFAPSTKVVRPRAPSPTSDQISIGFASFNVNGHIPSTIDDLSAWLNVTKDDPDILIVGLQEADSSGLSYVVWTPHVETAWTNAIEASMHRNAAQYTKLACKQLVGILIFVYVRTSMLTRIASPSMASVGVGFGGWMANKGAVAVRFVIDDMSFCFLVSHLSAFHTAEGLQRRRWDYHEIVKRLKFAIIKPATAIIDQDFESTADFGEHTTSAAEKLLRLQLDRSSTFSSNDEPSTAEKDVDDNAEESSDDIEYQTWHIFDHDLVFWGGDLNFRIELNELDTKRLIKKGQLRETLFRFDQLQSEITASRSFSGFNEHVIDFPPTYKFDRGTDVYDTSEKHRNPAWTDRILWRHQTAAETEHGKTPVVTPIIYESIPALCVSDHKPVYALFHVDVRHL